MFHGVPVHWRAISSPGWDSVMDAGLIFLVFHSVSFLCGSASSHNSKNSVLELHRVCSLF